MSDKVTAKNITETEIEIIIWQSRKQSLGLIHHTYNWGKMRFDVTSSDWETVGEHVLFWDSHSCEEEEEQA